jgi:hypothetical protein
MNLKHNFQAVDKSDNPSTTSIKFKQDVYDLVLDKDLVIEFGTHQGLTTGILASACKQIITINRTEELLEAARRNLEGFDNVTFLAIDLYDGHALENIQKQMQSQPFAVFIDAGHEFEQVLSDIHTALALNPQYIIFDDYGMNIHRYSVKMAIDYMINRGDLIIHDFIGEEPDKTFSATPTGVMRKLIDFEGVICMPNNTNS